MMNCRLMIKLFGFSKLHSQSSKSVCNVNRMLSSDSKKYKGEKVLIGDQTIHFEKVGKGKHTLFLMPGALGTSQDFSQQLEKLNHDKFTIIAWDPPGYGYSRPPDRNFTIDFFQDDAKVAVDLLKHLEISKVNIIGWSDGGNSALILAAQFPELVEKLVVFGSNSYVSEKDLQLYEAVRDINKWSDRMRKPMIEIYGEEYFNRTWNGWVDAMILLFKKKQGDVCRKELKQIKCPTLILHGKKDALVPRFHPIFIKENISKSKLIEFDDGKHNLHMQFADQFNSKIEEFILK